MKQTLLLDCDGPLADFSNHLLRCVGSGHTLADVSQVDIFGLIEQWHGEAVRSEALQFCDTSAFWAMMPVVPGAQEAVELFRQHCRVRVVTKPWSSCREWHWRRTQWLKRHFGFDESDVIPVSDKSSVRGDVLLDDLPSHLVDFPGEQVLYDAPYNRGSVHSRVHWTNNKVELSALGVVERFLKRTL